MNYTEKITLEQAIMFKKKQPFTQVKRILDGESLFVKLIQDIGIENLYANDGYILITRPDYAQYIQGNNPLPDGYGYPSKDLGSGLYNGIPYMFCFGDQSNIWLSTEQVFNLKTTTITKWYEVAFKLSDLARVEAESVVSKMERTEINAAQVEYLVKNEVKTKLFYQCGDEVVEQIRFWINDIEAAKNGTVFSLLTTDYNSLPDEFKALAEPKPSMPAHFEPDWKAKYIELEEQHNTLIKHLQEATASADAKQDIINNLEDKNKKLKFRLDDLHGYSPKDLKIAELEMQVDFNKDMRKMHLENVSNLHDFYHKIIWNLFGQLEK